MSVSLRWSYLISAKGVLLEAAFVLYISFAVIASVNV